MADCGRNAQSAIETVSLRGGAWTESDNGSKVTPTMRNHSLNFQSYARPRRDIQPSKSKGIYGDDDDDDDDDKDYDDDDDDDDDADDDNDR